LSDSNPERIAIDRLRAGDTDAIAQLYHQYAQPIYVLAVRMTGSTEDAEDVVHDVFAGLPRAIRSFTGSGSFENWLRKCATRVCLMMLRRRRIRREVSLDAFTSSVPSAADSIIARMSLVHGLAQLPNHLRIVLALKEVEGYTHREIADLLGISPQNSMIRLHRAREAMRALLGGGR